VRLTSSRGELLALNDGVHKEGDRHGEHRQNNIQQRGHPARVSPFPDIKCTQWFNHSQIHESSAPDEGELLLPLDGDTVLHAVLPSKHLEHAELSRSAKPSGNAARRQYDSPLRLLQ
jgi:hypothetical protein